MTSEFMREYRGPYYGRVIDGPFEGQYIESDSPHFVGHFQQPTVALWTVEASVVVEIDRVVYKWLHTYRAWAWWQRS